MTIKDVLQQLETAKHPVAKAIYKGSHFKILALAFKKGMVMKEHKTSLPAKLTVIYGAVIYTEGQVQKELLQYDETDIPADVVHFVECTQDALCLLIQG